MKSFETILDEAKELVSNDRNKSYGDAKENFDKASKIFYSWTGIQLSTRQISQVMQALKMAREEANPSHRDNYVDQAGYIHLRWLDDCRLPDKPANTSWEKPTYDGPCVEYDDTILTPELESLQNAQKIGNDLQEKATFSVRKKAYDTFLQNNWKEQKIENSRVLKITDRDLPPTPKKGGTTRDTLFFPFLIMDKVHRLVSEYCRINGFLPSKIEFAHCWIEPLIKTDEVKDVPTALSGFKWIGIEAVCLPF